MSAEAKASFKAAFDLIDNNGDGFICVAELKRLVEAAGESRTDAELKEMVDFNIFDAFFFKIKIEPLY